MTNNNIFKIAQLQLDRGAKTLCLEQKYPQIITRPDARNSRFTTCANGQRHRPHFSRFSGSVQ
jgi:hypothetical protein